MMRFLNGLWRQEPKKKKKVKEEEKSKTSKAKQESQKKERREKKVYDLPGQKRDPPEEVLDNVPVSC